MTRYKPKPFLPTSGTFYRVICEQLGVTEAGMKVLLRLESGDVISGGQAGVRLERDGLVTPQNHLGDGYWQRRLTETGLALCKRAHELGY